MAGMVHRHGGQQVREHPARRGAGVLRWPGCGRKADRITRFVERFDADVYVDCAYPDPSATLGSLAGRTVSVVSGPNHVGEFQVGADGVKIEPPPDTGDMQVGIPFTAEAKFWPVELVESPRVGMIRARVIRVAASVQGTAALQMALNRNVYAFGGYSVSDDLSLPPPLMTKVVRRPVMGTRDHPDLSIIKHVPGPFRVLSFTQEVQG